MPNNWLTHNEPEDKQDDTPKKRYIPSAAKLRKLAKFSTAGGRFFCPICNEAFSTTYGIFGKVGSFSEPSFYCRDCAKAEPRFQRMR